MPEQAKCRTCNAPVVWIKTNVGNLLPLDAVAVKDGLNLFAIVDGVAVRANTCLFDAVAAEGPRYTSHYATCPGSALQGSTKP